MLRSIKILFFTFILSLFTLSCVQAFDINMNLSDNTTNNNNISSLYSNNTSSQTTTSNQDGYSVSLSSMPEQELGFTNILNIIIIVIGILLILLAIAILIRLKQQQ